jgi:hypothetical protein
MYVCMYAMKGGLTLVENSAKGSTRYVGSHTYIRTYIHRVEDPFNQMVADVLKKNWLKINLGSIHIRTHTYIYTHIHTQSGRRL